MLRLDWNVIFTIINVIVLYLVLRRFLIQPIRNIIEKRESLIQRSMEHATKERENADQLKKQYETLLQGAKKESKELIEEAKETASKEYESLVRQAKEDTNRIRQDATQKIKQEKEQAKKDLQSQIALLAISAATKLMTNTNSSELNNKLYEQFFQEAGGLDGFDRQ